MAGFPELSAVLFDQQLTVENYEQQLYGDGRHLFSNCSYVQWIRNKASACLLTGQAQRLMCASFIGCIAYQIMRIRNARLKWTHISLSATSAVVAYGALHYLSGGSQAMKVVIKDSLVESLKETRAALFEMIDGYEKACELRDQKEFMEVLKKDAPSLKWAKIGIEKTPDINQRYIAFNAVLRHVGIEPLPNNGIKVLVEAAAKVC